MKKFAFLTLVSSLFSFGLQAQELARSEGDRFRESGDLPAAIEAYKSFHRTNPDDHDNTYNLACAFALRGIKDSAFYYLESSLQNDSSVKALNDPDLFGLTDDDRWQGIETSQIMKTEAKHGVYPNLELARKLWRMRMQDQAYYYHINIARDKMGRKSPVIQALWSLKHQLNEDNLTELRNIIDNQGWPKQSEVKGSAAQAVFLVIQHADLNTQKQYIGRFREACENKEADWANFALMYDRIEMREGRHQIYGSQVIMNEESGKYEPYKIKHPEKVNQRRKKMGLPPIEDYLQNWDIEWTVKQK